MELEGKELEKEKSILYMNAFFLALLKLFQKIWKILGPFVLDSYENSGFMTTNTSWEL